MTRSDWPEWKKAMDEELALMAKYDVWDEVDQPEAAAIHQNARGGCVLIKSHLIGEHCDPQCCFSGQ